jgi:group I intron endonuclease
MEIKIIIYCHTCTATGKKYVGQTMWTMNRRWRRHVNDAKSMQGCAAIGAAIRKYGEECWTHEILETVSSSKDADEAEAKWITKLNTIAPDGYNLEGGGRRLQQRPAQGARIRAAWLAKTEEWRQKRIADMRASINAWLATTTPEQRSQISRDARNSLSPEKRSEIAKRGKASMSPEARRIAATKANAGRTLEEMRAVRAQQVANTTPEQRREIAQKGAANLTPEQLERRRETGRQMMTALHTSPEIQERRIAAVRASHAKRRLMRALKLNGFTLLSVR